MDEITLTREESMHLLKALSQLDGIMMAVPGIPDAGFDILESASDMIEKKMSNKSGR